MLLPATISTASLVKPSSMLRTFSALASPTRSKMKSIDQVASGGRPHQRLPLDRRLAPLAAPPDMQFGFPVQPPGALVVNAPALAAHQHMQASIAEAASLVGEFDQAALELVVQRLRAPW